MPGGSGAPELFFAPVGRMADMGLTSAMDQYDHEMYVATVFVIESTVENVLDDNEQYVIRHKWLERNTMDLHKIAMLKDRDESTIRRWHRNALRKLSIAFMGLHKVPEIEAMPQKVV
jgi:DNA-directed RNA polymerase sigma subunit (sigma70/sigma32)